ncbi:T7SS effector LXG polymorphic toxin [Peribacillus butanolivorans]|uniref:LXG domain-containing protein n=1 Tax=Peribacillus butanolivorans TaxID=421767 RepID=A0ABN5N767_9BACI|nr:T7SS effector LXG polymorphic toxin [Peribacillus butanolivorans]AXN41259.1 hypothetical protein DTO10_24655 [Peribacillus butanolivorans]
MKIYEAKTLTAATKSRAKQYEELKKEVAALKKEFQGIVGLDHEFQGAGAAVIISFYEANMEASPNTMNVYNVYKDAIIVVPGHKTWRDFSLLPHTLDIVQKHEN